MTSENSPGTENADGTRGADQSANADTPIDGRTLTGMFFRSLSLEASFNYERQQSLGFAFTMAPVLRKLYSKREDQAAALKRHLEFFNTTPYIAGAVVGATAAVEEQYANEPSIGSESVNRIKAALMGPLAGIGDSLYWGTFRLICTGIGTSLAMSGNILGPILFLLGFNLPVQFLSWFYVRQAYRSGSKLIHRLSSGEGMRKLTYAAGILGMLVVGGMTSSMVTVNTPLEYTFGDESVAIQGILDEILPGMLALGTFWLIYWLLGKNFKVTTILILVFAISLLGAATGVLNVPEQ